MSEKPAKPIEIFYSYSHEDEELRDELEKHLAILKRQGVITGWHDRRIGAGKEWEDEIDEHLNTAHVILLLISSDFLASDYCYDVEMKRAMERHEAGEARVIPVILRPCDWKGAPFGKLQALPTYAKPVTSWTNRDKAFLDIARGIRAAVEELAGPLMQDAESVSGGDEITRQPSAKTEPPTRVVDQMHRRDHTTITEAIEAANPGDRILIRPGLYEEALVMDKPLEIIGEGSLNDVVIQAIGGRALLFKTTRGRVANLTLRQMGNGEFHCVDITQGCLELEGCDITSQSRACVAIHGGANPRLRHNRIHDGNEDGVYVYDDGQGVLEHNHIFDNAHVGVEIKTGGNPTLRHNHIYNNEKSGVYIYDNGQGMLEDNDIFRNAFCGVKIEDSSLTLRDNRIYDNRQDGVYMYGNSQGRLEHNYIFGNDHAGVEIAIGSNPTLRSNHIHDCKQTGVYVRADGLGMLEDNDIFDNAKAGVTITTGGNPTLRRNRINKNGYVAVQVYDGGGGTIEYNDLSGNIGGVWDISPDSEPTVKRAGNLE